MAQLRDRDEALARLQAYVQYDVAPELTAEEVGDILDRHQVAEEYDDEPHTYAPGIRVVPPYGNGRVYVSSPSGTAPYLSGATLADDLNLWPVPGRWPGDAANAVQDGDVLWVDDGPAPSSLWDLRAAAYEAWTMKAGKVAGSVNSQAGSLKKDCSDALGHCLAMARRFAPLGVA